MIPDYCASIVGYRAWDVVVVDGVGPRLRAISYDTIWPVDEPLVATGSAANSAGIHAFKQSQALSRVGGAVIGEVWLWGIIEEHADGYRAQYAYPKHLKQRSAFPSGWWTLADLAAEYGVLHRDPGQPFRDIFQSYSDFREQYSRKEKHPCVSSVSTSVKSWWNRWRRASPPPSQSRLRWATSPPYHVRTPPPYPWTGDNGQPQALWLMWEFATRLVNNLHALGVAFGPILTAPPREIVQIPLNYDNVNGSMVAVVASEFAALVKRASIAQCVKLDLPSPSGHQWHRLENQRLGLSFRLQVDDGPYGRVAIITLGGI